MRLARHVVRAVAVVDDRARIVTVVRDDDDHVRLAVIVDVQVHRRVVGYDESQTEAVDGVVAGVVGVQTSAGRAVVAAALVGAAAQGAVVAGVRRIARLRGHEVVPAPVVAAPFGHVTVHVVESPGVGLLQSHHMGRPAGVPEIPGIVAQRRRGRAEVPRPRRVRIVAGRHRARRDLPHRLRRQVEQAGDAAGAHERGELADGARVRRLGGGVTRAAQRVVADARFGLHVRVSRRHNGLWVLHELELPDRHLVDADVVVLRHRRLHGAVLHGVRARRHLAEDHLRCLVHVVRVVRGDAGLVSRRAADEIHDHVVAEKVDGREPEPDARVAGRSGRAATEAGAAVV